MTELNFKGKEFVWNHHLTVAFRPLKPHPEKGIGDSALDSNLLIHGDNLHALKALLPTYAGKVDCVFIDPPYNIGKKNKEGGWSYNDNVNAPMIREWLAENPIGSEDGLRHDKWCAMMWPRLRLLHELLSDEGTLWMTLDGNEAHRAKLMLDEIFGEDCHLGTVVWEKSDSPRMDAEVFSTSHDYLIAFAKRPGAMIFHKLKSDETNPPDHYNRRDDDGRLYYIKPLRAMGAEDRREDRPSMFFSLVDPDGNDIFPCRSDGSEGRWRWQRGTIEKEKERIEWVKTRNGWSPHFRVYADSSNGRPPGTIWYHEDVGSSRAGIGLINKIFGMNPFDNPKPIGLVNRVLEIATERDSIVLDSFAGSGTTGHAVLEANAFDGGDRRFILVEMEDYADKTAERIRRVISGYTFTGVVKTRLHKEKLNWTKVKHSDRLIESVENIKSLRGHEHDRVKPTLDGDELVVTGETRIKQRTKGLGGTFTYCTLGPPIELDKILTGEALPEWDALGGVLFHAATLKPFDPANANAETGYVGAGPDRHVWLLYTPDRGWLRSPEAALTLSRAREIHETDPATRHLVFAPARHVAQKMLDEQDLNVEYAPLPLALDGLGGD
ncbi:site-specific DNA-methyltransferase [Aquisalimonas sp. 2447]|uniref:site-specific DNA-methyltransferase n=1 Tax=Aquisalimonas sp. 2447 TaxID=2740807 RepID=UPI0014324E90|nr:site-specific DNA-methyltransferase [Aquisalimonas sp. 2447]QIT55024.1 site-specific DNA-methyltransferase [Aquisalimonas sp. 2447]